MKKTILDSIVSIITTSFLYFIFSLISASFLADKGCVRITGTYKDENVYRKNIELVNDIRTLSYAQDENTATYSQGIKKG